MDKLRVQQVPEGNGEEWKVENNGSKVICGVSINLPVKGLMMMMMMMMVMVTMRDMTLPLICLNKPSSEGIDDDDGDNDRHDAPLNLHHLVCP